MVYVDLGRRVIVMAFPLSVCKRLLVSPDTYGMRPSGVLETSALDFVASVCVEGEVVSGVWASSAVCGDGIFDVEIGSGLAILAVSAATD